MGSVNHMPPGECIGVLYTWMMSSLQVTTANHMVNAGHKHVTTR
jgi:hypothetical protein